MKRSDLIALGLEKDAVDAVLDLHKGDVELWKAQRAELEGDIAFVKAAKPAAGDGEDWKKKFDDEVAAHAATSGKLSETEEKVNTLTAAHAEALASAETDTLLREAMAGLKFSSAYAKKGIMEAVRGKVTSEDGKLTGFSEAIAEYQESEPDAFVIESTGEAQKPAKDDPKPLKNEGKPHKPGAEDEDLFAKGFDGT